MNNLFIKASKLKLRFTTKVGLLSAEDLWDLPLTSNTGKVNLNEIAVGVHSKLEASPKVSFVDTVSSKDELNEMRLEILKHVISVKQEDNKAKSEAKDRADEKRKLLSLLQKRQEAKLDDLSEEDLIKRLEAL